MKAVFSGYYGHKNTGDDAFVEVAAWGSKKYWCAIIRIVHISDRSCRNAE